MVEDTL